MYSSSVEITVITEIYEVAIIIYFVPGGQMTQLSTVTVGQVAPDINTGCFKMSFTTLNEYTNLYRGHTQRLELS
jgi:hypothetical protein